MIACVVEAAHADKGVDGSAKHAEVALQSPQRNANSVGQPLRREFFLGQVTIDENLHYLDTMIGAIAWDRKIVRVVRRKRLTRCAEQELTQLRSSLVAAIGPHQFGY